MNKSTILSALFFLGTIAKKSETLPVTEAEAAGYRGLADITCYYSDGTNWLTDTEGISLVTPSDSDYSYAVKVTLTSGA